jgi:hypothetical protein
LHIESYEIPTPYLDEPYFYEFWAVGGTEPYTWTFVGGDLPLGLSFTGGATATLSGTPVWPATYYFTVAVSSSDEPPLADTMTCAMEVTERPYVCGDTDSNGLVNVSDVVYLINYIFGGGPAPLPLESGDVDCNGVVNIPDAVYLIAYIFGGGPEPCAGCS